MIQGETRRSVAVIGAGISGMGAAYALSGSHRVTLYEAEPRLGGHARTRLAGPRGDQTVDTGFIVFNKVTYPNLVRLFEDLDVPVVPSNMSFGASIGGGRIEYGLRNLTVLFAQPRNLAKPSFLRMIRDILHFNAHALKASADSKLTVGDLIRRLGLGVGFREHYLLPLTGAIWSTPKARILDFPAHAMVRFMLNHGLLNHAGQHQWYTVDGGSEAYVSRLGAALTANGADLRLGAPVQSVRRGPDGAWVKAPGGTWDRFDEVIFATHSDDTLAMIEDPTPQERRVLGSVRYQPNDVVLHSDASVMPRRRSVWSSWTYTEGPEGAGGRIGLTYWMNSLQPWLTEPLFVTLNHPDDGNRAIREDLVWDRAVLRHPVFDLAALAAQDEAAQMSGLNRTWFCGAWMGHGFHEDGLASGLAVADGIAAQGAMAVAAE